MLHLLYILAFTTIALFAISNLINNLITLSTQGQRVYPNNANNSSNPGSRSLDRLQQIHPELLDESGKVIDEPLLVMRSLSVEDARDRLDSLYNSSPEQTQGDRES